MPPENVVDLRNKLNVLYEWAWPDLIDRARARTDSHDDRSGDGRLARLLELKQNNISIWVHGKDGRAPGMIPHDHFVAICDEIFKIPRDLFAEKPLNDMQQWCKQHEFLVLWDKLIAQAQELDAFNIERKQLHPDALKGNRGLVRLPKNPVAELPKFRVHEEIALRLNLSGSAWQAQAEQGIGLLILSQDEGGCSVVYPSIESFIPPACIRASEFREPSDDDEWLGISKPAGIQTEIALLTEQVLPGELILNLLQRPDETLVNKEALNDLATLLRRGKYGRHAVYRRMIFVEDAV